MPDEIDDEDIPVPEKTSAPPGPSNPPKATDGEGEKSLFKIPLLILNDVVVFPYALSPLVIDSKETIALIENVIANDRLIGLFPIYHHLPSHSGTPELFDEKDIETFTVDGKLVSIVGVVARIVKMLKFPDGTVRVLVRGLKRLKAIKLVNQKEPYTIEAEEILEEPEDSIEITAMIRNAINQFQEIISSSPFYPEELRVAIINIDDNSRLVDLISETLNIGLVEKLHLLATTSIQGRLQLLMILLNREIEVLRVGTKIQSQISSAMSKTQRDYFLREQLKTIQKELGEESKNPDIKALEEKMKTLKLPDKAEKAVQKELHRLESIPQASAEYSVSHTYIDWILSLPWNVFTEDRIDINEAEKILDEDHYDLKPIKDVILDFLSVLQLKKDKKSPILCFIGPPGVGKTSLGQSIARSMQRKFVRMSLGGIRDEAEIRGHRRTYIGALPGRIIQGLKKAQCANPIFMLDEIDKIGADFRGDPASALLEVLDPQQNSTFMDHYVELEFDLSSVMFIATGNITDTIPSALIDRMEIIYLPGYTASEKKEIAKRFIVPRQIKDCGLEGKDVSFSDEAISSIIHNYTREAGVRNLERNISKISRKIARRIVQKKKNSGKFVISSKDLQKYLGPQKFFLDEAELKPETGIATGMAWTSAGGTIIAVEVTYMPGKGALKLTGSLGDVMKESAETAFSYAKSHHKDLGIDPAIFTSNDFHIHIPDGATPKDGPSAGITILVALVSSVTKKAVKELLAMTGEITLRGKVTPVGGIKEKVIAAMAAGIRTVLLPEKNAKDLIELPPEVKKTMKFVKIKNAMQVIKLVLITNKTLIETTEKPASPKKTSPKK